jgi:Tfp pilus assembly protein PilZ
MKEKRKHIRHPVSKFAEVVVKDRRYHGIVLDLTEGGSFISAHGAFSIGNIITVTYQLDDGPIGEIRRIGTIKWITGKGIGIEFKRPGYSD